jgi:4-nitrophenyl phosphatase
VLAARFQGIVFDLDGVVYLGEEVVPAAPGALDQVRGLGVKIAFVTNNSYRPTGQVVEKLNRLGIKAAEDEVLTSAQAAVRLLDGPAWPEAEVVAVGFDPELTYARVRDATLAIRAGARFVGSNPDTTLPTREGLWPGAGATLALLRASTGVRPEVAGKPERALLETAAAAIGPGPYLMVGDRADTDLDGAHRLGWSTCLVLSGVTALADLPDLANAPDQLLADVGGLLDPPGPVVRLATPADQPAATRLLQAGPEAATGGPEATDGSGDTAGGTSEANVRPAKGTGGLGDTAGGPTDAGGQPAKGTARTTEATGGPLLVVAADGERVVGAAAVRRDGDLGLLDGPVVEEAWRGRLVGTRLAAAACIQARAAGLHRVAAAAAAEAFLARLGFRRGTDQDPPLVRDLGGEAAVQS